MVQLLPNVTGLSLTNRIRPRYVQILYNNVYIYITYHKIIFYLQQSMCQYCVCLLYILALYQKLTHLFLEESTVGLVNASVLQAKGYISHSGRVCLQLLVKKCQYQHFSQCHSIKLAKVCSYQTISSHKHICSMYTQKIG